FLPLLERVLLYSDKVRRIVLGRRIRTFPLREREFFDARGMHQPGKTVISFDAARFVINPVRLLVLPGELLLRSPGSRPHRRVVDGDGVFERVRTGACPAFDQMQSLARALVIGLRTE